MTKNIMEKEPVIADNIYTILKLCARTEKEQSLRKLTITTYSGQTLHGTLREWNIDSCPNLVHLTTDIGTVYIDRLRIESIFISTMERHLSLFVA